MTRYLYRSTPSPLPAISTRNYLPKNTNHAISETVRGTSRLLHLLQSQPRQPSRIRSLSSGLCSRRCGMLRRERCHIWRSTCCQSLAGTLEMQHCFRDMPGYMSYGLESSCERSYFVRPTRAANGRHVSWSASGSRKERLMGLWMGLRRRTSSEGITVKGPSRDCRRSQVSRV